MHNDGGGRRLVIFCGPHKSASSSVQELFMKTAASNLEKHHPALVNWTWPYNVRRRSYLPRKGFAPLVTEGEGFVRLIHETILSVWNSSSTNLILGTEELDRFGPTPWSHRDGIQAIRRIQQLVKPDRMQVVLNYRRPRRDQWISVWKQLTRAKPRNYADFLCDTSEYDRIWEYLDCVANPLGLVNALLEQDWDVVLLDMQGMASKNWDVGHVIACDVLGAPCDDHWLSGIDRPILQNTKSGNPALTPEQMDDLEWALRQRDCGYRLPLTSNSHLRILQGETLWENCNDWDDEQSQYFTDTTNLLDLLQSQLGCSESHPTNAISHLRDESSTAVIQRKITTRLGGVWQPPGLDEGATSSWKERLHWDAKPKKEESLGSSEEERWFAAQAQRKKEGTKMPAPALQDMQNEVFCLYALLLIMIAWIMRRVKCKALPTTRRLGGKYLRHRRQERR